MTTNPFEDTVMDNAGDDNGRAAFLGNEHEVVKEFPARGNIQQFRLNKVSTFTCSRCCKSKTAKLVAVRNGDWTGGSGSEGGFLCNGCYGWLCAHGN